MYDDPNKNAKRLVLLFWVVVAFYYFCISYDYISKELRNDRLAAYIHHVVQLSGNETRTPREIRSLLMAKADELSIPLEPEEIKIVGSGPSLKVSLGYDVTIQTPIVAVGLYTKHYDHTIAYRDMRF
jgi:hypothetical protein